MTSFLVSSWKKSGPCGINQSALLYVTKSMDAHLLDSWMQFPIQENAAVEVLLGCIAQILVFFQHLFEEVPDAVECLVRGVFVAVDFYAI